jgi:hypothetical protein
MACLDLSEIVKIKFGYISTSYNYYKNIAIVNDK